MALGGGRSGTVAPSSGLTKRSRVHSAVFIDDKDSLLAYERSSSVTLMLYVPHKVPNIVLLAGMRLPYHNVNKYM